MLRIDWSKLEQAVIAMPSGGHRTDRKLDILKIPLAKRFSVSVRVRSDGMPFSSTSNLQFLKKIMLATRMIGLPLKQHRHCRGIGCSFSAVWICRRPSTLEYSTIFAA
jgi:hypothetical protein